MFLNIILEVILFIIIVGGSRYGYNKGLFKLAAKPLKLLLCITLSFSLSRIVGSYFIAPAILSRVSERTANIAYPAINALSAVIAFVLLFFILKLLLTFIISFFGRFFDDGVIGKINKALGLMLSGLIAFIVAMCLASLTEYLFMRGTFRNFALFRDFSGGLLYRILVKISPLKLLFMR